MKSVRPSVIIAGLGLATVGLVVILGTMPQLAALTLARSEIDSVRLNIASIEQQQANLANVQREFATLQAQEQSLQAQYATTDQTIALFNTIDELFVRAGVADGQLRLDTPSPGAEYQVTGAHLTFQATYRELIEFIRQLNTTKPLVRIQSLSVSAASARSQLTATIDGLVPWRLPR
ncbi:MAG: type 4a pilus biogenesis protein PilO [Candidatus Kerfeldbacteria bacterium]|nr:type 4a pilus biogenesis protein PilO [Candidatus Kerfeldbacteria bacterium]